MDWLGIINISGSIASLVSLFVAFLTLYKVTTLPAALKQHSRERQLTELIDKIVRIPPAKPTIPDSTTREVEIIIRIVRLYYVSKIPLRHRTLKSLLGTLDAELRGQKQRAVIQHQLRLIRDEITIR
jgi:hypothetical protein